MPRPDQSTIERSADTAVPPTAWDSDPIVVVSKRARNIPFPAAVLLRAPTEDDVRAWEGASANPTERNDKTVTIGAGVTFLGVSTTAWSLMGTRSPSEAPRAAPPPDACVLVSPSSNAGASILGERSPFMDRLTRRIDARQVAAAWRRVFDYLRDQETRAVARSHDTFRLFAVDDGYDAPEVLVLSLGEVLKQSTTAGQQAYAHTMAAIPWAKDGAHLGALHDYAARVPAGWTIVEACRARGRAATALLGPRR